MFPEVKNSIGNLSFQLLYSGDADGMEVKKTTEDIVDHRFLPALEQLLDEHSTAGDVIIIDKIECDITIDGSELNDTLIKKIMAQLEKQLLDRGVHESSGNSPKALSIQQRFIKTLLFYLKNGHLPWWATIASKQELNEMVLSLSGTEMHPADITGFLALLKTENVVRRICNDFDDEAFWEVLKWLPLYNQHIAVIELWKKDYSVIVKESYSSRSSIYFPFVYKKNILKALAANDTPVLTGHIVELSELFVNFFTIEELVTLPVKSISKINDPVLKARLKFIETQEQQITQKAKQNKDIEPDESAIEPKKKKEAPADDEEKEDKPAVEPMYIKNSGLVIIASYLGMFFNKLGLVKDGGITDTTRAITLLHYIASGDTLFAEFEVTLPKLLCGVDIEEAVKSKYEITPEDAEEVDELLKAVIANWPVLKNTSPDGLRSAFLMRDGKLAFKGNSYQLKVQEQAIDVLVQHLPWSISMIKLSWMKHLLIVDWM